MAGGPPSLPTQVVMRGPDPSIQGDRSVACSGPSARGPRVTNGGVATNSPTHRCRPGSWPYCFHPATGAGTTAVRSEEHTSELQSLMRISYAVFCLKKKTKSKRQYHT